jgi:hypothetical protein
VGSEVEKDEEEIGGGVKGDAGQGGGLNGEKL